MSTDPTGLGNKNCVESIKKKYINISFDRSDWCSYKGECLIDDMPIGKERACLFCKYRIPIDIPWKLDLKMRERTNTLWRNFK